MSEKQAMMNFSQFERDTQSYILLACTIDTHLVHVRLFLIWSSLYYRCIWAGLNHVWVSIDLYTSHNPREGRVERASNNIHRYLSVCDRVF